MATTIAQQVNSLVGNVAKEIDGGGKDEVELELLNDSSDSEIKPIIISTVNDAPKSNMGFLMKGEMKKHAGPTPQFGTQAKWLDHNGISSDERRPTEILTKEELIKNLKVAFAEARGKDTATFQVYVPDVKSGKRIAAQLGSDVATDVDGNAVVAVRSGNPAKRKRNYILLCRKTAEDGTAMQKLRGKDCVKVLRNEFYLEHSMKNRKDGTTSLMGLKIGARTNGMKDSESDSYEIK